MNYLFFLIIYGFAIHATWKAATNAAAKRFNREFRNESLRIRNERAMYRERAAMLADQLREEKHKVRLLEDAIHSASEIVALPEQLVQLQLSGSPQ